MSRIDDINRRILRELTRDARISNIDLAARAGLSPSACLRRVQEMERSGVIRGYRAVLDPVQMGTGFLAYVTVRLSSHTKASHEAFERAMARAPEVRECHMLNGEIDFILKIVSRDLQSFQEFLTSKLTPAPNVASVKTSLTIRTAKQLPGVPLGD
jgi:DNA-binding Lrp family transcriptional regulator